MFIVPPPTTPLTATHWVYDDPSGIAEPAPYRRAWRRSPRRAPQNALLRPVPRIRVAHRES